MILVISLSIFVCAYASMGMHDAHHLSHAIFSVGHMEHARSLTLAIIPTFFYLAFLFVICTFIVFVLNIEIKFEESSGYFLNDSSPPPKKETFYLKSNPRSPPIY